MQKNDEDKLQRLLLPLDLISVALSLLLAIYIRFHKSPGLIAISQSYDGLYYLIFALVLIIYVAVFFLTDSGNKSLIEQDPFDKTVNVIKNQLMMLFLLICFLYLIRVGYWASRAVVVMFFVFSTIIDTVARFIYGRYLSNRAKAEYRPERYLLITEDEAPEKISVIAEKLLSPGDTIIETVTISGLRSCKVDKGSFDEILVLIPGVWDARISEEIREFAGKAEKPVRAVLNKDGVFASGEVIRYMRGVPVLRYGELQDRCPVLGVDFNVSNLTEAVSYIKENAAHLKGKYICFGNVHTTVMAHEDGEYRGIQNGAVFVMPDGMPIVKAQKKKGCRDACRVAGPDFMGKTFQAAMDGKLSMYFYGATEETEKALEEKLRKDYPGIDLRGFESPPFRDLTPEEDEETVKRINESGADILWVGLGAPKQERWMVAHAGRIKALMLGVGAGFDFHAGTTKRAPFWIQKIGMEWLYRLFQDPKRLLKRYVVTNIKFLLYSRTDK